jgi:hypothetical protein
LGVDAICWTGRQQSKLLKVLLELQMLFGHTVRLLAGRPSELAQPHRPHLLVGVLDAIPRLAIIRGQRARGGQATLSLHLINERDIAFLQLSLGQLAAVIGSGPLPRGQVVSKIWEYIRSHNLQNPENRREIVADDQLRRVFGKDKVTMFEMNKHLAAHLT